MIEPVTLASTAATQQAIKASVLNIRRISMPLILSITSTLFLLGITILFSGYLTRTNREFATRICLFLTGVSTAVTIHLIDKGINGLSLQAEILEEDFAMPKQSRQIINIENFSGNLIDNNVPGDIVLSSGSGSDSFSLPISDSKVAEFSDSSLSEVVVMEPHSFEEIPKAVRSIQEGKSVVLNLTILDPDAAQRAVDFVAGGTYGMKGHQERIGESIFLFTPQAIQPSASRIPEQETSLSNSELSPISTPTPRLRLLSFAQEEGTQVKTRGDAG